MRRWLSTRYCAAPRAAAMRAVGLVLSVVCFAAVCASEAKRDAAEAALHDTFSLRPARLDIQQQALTSQAEQDAARTVMPLTSSTQSVEPSSGQLPILPPTPNTVSKTPPSASKQRSPRATDKRTSASVTFAHDGASQMPTASSDDAKTAICPTTNTSDLEAPDLSGFESPSWTQSLSYTGNIPAGPSIDALQKSFFSDPSYPTTVFCSGSSRGSVGTSSGHDLENAVSKAIYPNVFENIKPPMDKDAEEKTSRSSSFFANLFKKEPKPCLTVAPVNYNIFFVPNFAKMNYIGYILTEVQFETPIEKGTFGNPEFCVAIPFRASALELVSASYMWPDGQIVPASSHTVDKSKNAVIVTVPSNSLPNVTKKVGSRKSKKDKMRRAANAVLRTISFELQFSGKLRNRADGGFFYIQNMQVAGANFASLWAREIMPCWENPEVRVPITLSMDLPVGSEIVGPNGLTSTTILQSLPEDKQQKKMFNFFCTARKSIGDSDLQRFQNPFEVLQGTKRFIFRPSPFPISMQQMGWVIYSSSFYDLTMLYSGDRFKGNVFFLSPVVWFERDCSIFTQAVASIMDFLVTHVKFLNRKITIITYAGAITNFDTPGIIILSPSVVYPGSSSQVSVRARRTIIRTVAMALVRQLTMRIYTATNLADRWLAMSIQRYIALQAQMKALNWQSTDEMGAHDEIWADFGVEELEPALLQDASYNAAPLINAADLPAEEETEEIPQTQLMEMATVISRRIGGTAIDAVEVEYEASAPSQTDSHSQYEKPPGRKPLRTSTGRRVVVPGAGPKNPEAPTTTSQSEAFIAATADLISATIDSANNEGLFAKSAYNKKSTTTSSTAYEKCGLGQDNDEFNSGEDEVKSFKAGNADSYGQSDSGAHEKGLFGISGSIMSRDSDKIPSDFDIAKARSTELLTNPFANIYQVKGATLLRMLEPFVVDNEVGVLQAIRECRRQMSWTVQCISAALKKRLVPQHTSLDVFQLLRVWSTTPHFPHLTLRTAVEQQRQQAPTKHSSTTFVKEQVTECQVAQNAGHDTDLMYSDTFNITDMPTKGFLSHSTRKPASNVEIEVEEEAEDVEYVDLPQTVDADTSDKFINLEKTRRSSAIPKFCSSEGNADQTAFDKPQDSNTIKFTKDKGNSKQPHANTASFVQVLVVKQAPFTNAPMSLEADNDTSLWTIPLTIEIHTSAGRTLHTLVMRRTELRVPLPPDCTAVHVRRGFFRVEQQADMILPLVSNEAPKLIKGEKSVQLISPFERLRIVGDAFALAMSDHVSLKYALSSMLLDTGLAAFELHHAVWRQIAADLARALAPLAVMPNEVQLAAQNYANRIITPYISNNLDFKTLSNPQLGHEQYPPWQSQSVRASASGRSGMDSMRQEELDAEEQAQIELDSPRIAENLDRSPVKQYSQNTTRLQSEVAGKSSDSHAGYDEQQRRTDRETAQALSHGVKPQHGQRSIRTSQSPRDSAQGLSYSLGYLSPPLSRRSMARAMSTSAMRRNPLAESDSDAARAAMATVLIVAAKYGDQDTLMQAERLARAHMSAAQFANAKSRRVAPSDPLSADIDLRHAVYRVMVAMGDRPTFDFVLDKHAKMAPCHERAMLAEVLAVTSRKELADNVASALLLDDYPVSLVTLISNMSQAISAQVIMNLLVSNWRSILCFLLSSAAPFVPGGAAVLPIVIKIINSAPVDEIIAFLEVIAEPAIALIFGMAKREADLLDAYQQCGGLSNSNW